LLPLNADPLGGTRGQVLNWDAIGAVGEVMGAVAVLVTLGYLAVQIRQNTQSVSTSVYESAMSGFNALTRDLTANADLASILIRAHADPASLDENEQLRLNAYIRSYANHLYKLHRLYQQGAFPEADWSNVVREAAQLFAGPAYSDFKENNRFFAELWVEVERHAVEEFTNFGFGGPAESS
jgi:hypothetical protein